MTLAFTMLCIMLALHMTLKETLRYLKNEDISTVRYKEFNRSPRDTFPVFSICFTDDQADGTRGRIHTFFESDINSALHLSVDEYTRILKGEVLSRVTNEGVLEKIDIRNISSSDIGRFTIELSNLYQMVDFKTQNTDNDFQLMHWDNEVPIPFYVSHQDPGTICFTRRQDKDNGVIRTNDDLSLKGKMLDDRFDDKVVFKLYVHHPGQLIRSIRSPIFESTIHGFDWNLNILSFKISQVSILRKRHDANERCNTDLHDDDQQRRIEIVEKVGCIPIYWVNLMPTNFSIGECKLPQDLSQVYQELEHIAVLKRNYDPPCYEMKLGVTFEQRGSGYGYGYHIIQTNFRYMDTSYQEIINVREFGLESLWSGVGGFVGIFVGTSLLQIPSLVLETLKGLRNQVRSFNGRKLI